MSTNSLLLVGVVVGLGVIIAFARFWLFASAIGNYHRRKASLIAESDLHLTFDERITERLREMEQESGAKTPFRHPAPSQPATGFGRRGL